ncbi:MAG: hypothetical protein ACYCOR_02245 [Acidobacteriaceae bacterium]
MTTHKTPSTAIARINSLAALGLEDVYYWICVSLEKFSLDKFLGTFSREVKAEAAGGVMVSPKDPDVGEYHIRFNWYVEEKEINLRISFMTGTREHDKDEREPYAEEFMQWLGQFFKYESAQSHSHAHFEYPVESKQSKFPLPLKTNLAGDAEIDGISLSLPSRPDGVSKVRMSQGKKVWYVDMVADRKIVFNEFNLQREIEVRTSVLDTLMEERKP